MNWFIYMLKYFAPTNGHLSSSVFPSSLACSFSLILTSVLLFFCCFFHPKTKGVNLKLELQHAYVNSAGVSCWLLVLHKYNKSMCIPLTPGRVTASMVIQKLSLC